ncbi:MAG TPA: hypothetical protein VLE22_20285 [Bryobacteraceae bacterium]|nr:hypothetical protein [Bryobacteraceae bacterium]
MIQRKLEGLQEPEEELLECASVAGVKFSPVIVAMVLGRDAEEVEGQCAELASRGTLLRPCSLTEWPDDEVSSWFTFGHSLYQQVLYERIPPSRKARLHRRVGERLERTFGPSAADRAGELAHHFLAGRDPERALVHLQAAAEAALRKSAPREAAVHLRRGLQLLKTLPETRDHQTREFTLLAMLAPTAIAIEGFAAPDAENGFGRACEIGERLGDSERVSQVILGRAFMHELRGEYYLTEELLGQHLEQAVPQQSPTVAVHADSLMACSLFHQGKFAGALQRAEHALQIYHAGRDREFLAPYGENPSVACQAWAALSLWFLGFPDRAARQVDHLVAFSEAPDHGFTLSTATMYAAHVHQLRRDGACAAQWSERTLRLAQAQGYLYNVSFAKVVKGWADVESGNSEIGLALIREGLAIAESIGAKLDRPYLLALCAEAQLACGRPAAAFADLKEALSLVRASRAFFYEAELYRLRAAATLRSGAVNAESEAEADLKTALDVARPQGAKSLELRAATDLSALLRKQNRVPAARQILAAPYRLFSEGFQTRDLQEAGTLLDQLG